MTLEELLYNMYPYDNETNRQIYKSTINKILKMPPVYAMRLGLNNFLNTLKLFIDKPELLSFTNPVTAPYSALIASDYISKPIGNRIIKYTSSRNKSNKNKKSKSYIEDIIDRLFNYEKQREKDSHYYFTMHRKGENISNLPVDEYIFRGDKMYVRKAKKYSKPIKRGLRTIKPDSYIRWRDIFEERPTYINNRDYDLYARTQVPTSSVIGDYIGSLFDFTQPLYTKITNIDVPRDVYAQHISNIVSNILSNPIRFIKSPLRTISSGSESLFNLE